MTKSAINGLLTEHIFHSNDWTQSITFSLSCTQTARPSHTVSEKSNTLFAAFDQSIHLHFSLVALLCSVAALHFYFIWKNCLCERENFPNRTKSSKDTSAYLIYLIYQELHRRKEFSLLPYTIHCIRYRFGWLSLFSAYLENMYNICLDPIFFSIPTMTKTMMLAMIRKIAHFSLA